MLHWAVVFFIIAIDGRASALFGGIAADSA